MTRSTPRRRAGELERRPKLRRGVGEQFVGYGVLGLPFTLGDILGFRRFTASSLGPAHTAVWHRDPERRWTVYTDTDPARSCPRYFGAALTRSVEAEIRVEWTGTHRLAVVVPEHHIEWALRLEATTRTRLATGLLRLLPRGRGPAADPGQPDRSSRPDRLGAALGALLQAGPLRLGGTTPNGPRFRQHPDQVWAVTAAAAVAAGRELGPLGPHPNPDALGDLVMPARGLFTTGRWSFEPLDPTRHLHALSRRELRPARDPHPTRS